jgi:UDP-N-acetylglucosamine/UDP-N-acetylgalactosamine diphosphorylase
LQAQRIARLQVLAGEKTGKSNVVIPWYIMTSGATFEATRDFFTAHSYFGLDPANVLFFEQGLIPALTFEGKLILETKCTLFRAPNGNGGLYEALVSAGMLADMHRRGIRYTHVYCVDNILVKVADPVFVGYADSVGVGCAAKVVPKDAPHEKVGVVCRVAGKFKVQCRMVLHT